MKILRKAITAAAIAGAFAASAPASAVIILDNWDFRAELVQGLGLPAGSWANALNYDTTSAAGMSRFVSDGQALVVQNFTGGGGLIPQNGDRFYEVGYLAVNSYSLASGDTGGIGDIIGTNANLYFIIEGGGALNLMGPAPTYAFDFFRASLIADDDDINGPGSLGTEVANANGQSYNSLIAALASSVAAGTFTMPTGPADAALSGSNSAGKWLNLGVAAIDPDLVELARISFPNGKATGFVPTTGLIAGSALSEGLFGVTAPTTDCASGIFFDGQNGNDLCDSSNTDPWLSSYFWTVSGNSGNIPGTIGGVPIAGNGTTLFVNGGVGQLLLLQNLGDDAAPAIPEPTSLALLGIGMFGLAAARRRRQAA